VKPDRYRAVKYSAMSQVKLLTVENDNGAQTENHWAILNLC